MNRWTPVSLLVVLAALAGAAPAQDRSPRDQPVDLRFRAGREVVAVAFGSGQAWRETGRGDATPVETLPPAFLERLRARVAGARDARAGFAGDLGVAREGPQDVTQTWAFEALDTDDPAVQPLVLDLLQLRQNLLPAEEEDGPTPPASEALLRYVAGSWVVDLDLATGRAELRRHALVTSRLPPDEHHQAQAEVSRVAARALPATAHADLARFLARAASRPTSPHELRDPEVRYRRCDCDEATRRLLVREGGSWREVDLGAEASQRLVQEVLEARAHLLAGGRSEVPFERVHAAWEAGCGPWSASIDATGTAHVTHDSRAFTAQVDPALFERLRTTLAMVRLGAPFSTRNPGDPEWWARFVEGEASGHGPQPVPFRLRRADVLFADASYHGGAGERHALLRALEAVLRSLTAPCAPAVRAGLVDALPR